MVSGIMNTMPARIWLNGAAEYRTLHILTLTLTNQLQDFTYIGWSQLTTRAREPTVAHLATSPDFFYEINDALYEVAVFRGSLVRSLLYMRNVGTRPHIFVVNNYNTHFVSAITINAHMCLVALWVEGA